jgi:hypothetical protein
MRETSLGQMSEPWTGNLGWSALINQPNIGTMSLKYETNGIHGSPDTPIMISLE